MANQKRPGPDPDPETLLTDAERRELDAAAAITPDDVARAQQGWRSLAPAPARTLLDAAPGAPDA